MFYRDAILCVLILLLIMAMDVDVLHMTKCDGHVCHDMTYKKIKDIIITITFFGHDHAICITIS